MYISFLDRDKKRDRACMGEFNTKATAHKLETAAAEIKELDEEADAMLNDQSENCVHVKFWWILHRC